MFDLFHRLPKWIKPPLFILALPFIIIFGLLQFIYIFMISIPYLSIKFSMQERNEWKMFRKNGQVATWESIEPELLNGTVTLLVEIWPTGTGRGWLLYAPRHELDPESKMPTWHEYERAKDAMWLKAEEDDIGKWESEQLPSYQSTAKVLIPKSRQLSKLPIAVKRESVIITFFRPKQLES